ncbi:hypothetical protein [Paraburkholderia tropica]|uniref:hypothetical protein n=1 Tax=Paraburkholderia tropica TaxID=92647 RepID=UPI002AB64CB9|nr:hypothetical protein [Paraburkholderia tropica]
MTSVDETRGITEEYWATLHEDRKLCWDLFSQATAFVAALFVLKTGVLFVDIVIGIFTAFTPRLIVRSQRALSKHSKGVRTRLSDAMVVLSAGGTLAIGLLYYGLAVIQATASTYASEVKPAQQHDAVVALMYTVIFLFACISAPVIAWRRMMLGDLFFRTPKRAFTRLFIDRAFVARQFETFAMFEITIQLAGYAYATVCANLMNLYLHLFRIA